jgi:hypothetical protein
MGGLVGGGGVLVREMGCLSRVGESLLEGVLVRFCSTKGRGEADLEPANVWVGGRGGATSWLISLAT